MMRFTVFDVGHGSCALATAENGEAILIDCGHKTEPEYRPSQFLPAMGLRRLAHLFVTNFDEDHVSDLPQLAQKLDLSPTHFHRNRSMDANDLRLIKLQSGPVSPAMSATLNLHQNYIYETPPPLPTPGVSWQTFYNAYPAFTDTNNLSLLVVLRVGTRTILLPGDLESPGWEALLPRPDFRAVLGTVHIFIASHHGRDNGYCADVFTYCHPEVVVFSDSAIRHATQEMAATYGQHARGTTLNGQPRNVITTRQDGTVWWEIP